MPSRYSSAYKPIDWRQYLDQPIEEEPAGAKKARESRDWWKNLGDVAPLIGTGLGAVGGGIVGGLLTLPAGGVGALPGAAAGAGIGHGLGQAGQAAAYGQSENAMAPVDEEEARRRQKLIEREARMAAIRDVMGMIR